jgi:hypothetical protein
MKGPIAIGGIGGSGTRIVAQLLLDCGIYMGAFQNEMQDNLWFTLLFRRLRWLENASDTEIEKTIRVFDEAMNGKFKPTISQRLLIYKAEWEFIRRHYIKSNEWISLPVTMASSLISSRKNKLNNYLYWGWKEPNTHLFLEPFSKFYPNMKYIHVMRNGLDMAYSKNQLQLRNWGGRMGVKNLIGPPASLEYWIRANNKAIETATQLMKDNFLLVRFEELCLNSLEEVTKIINFLEISVDEQLLQQLVRIPKLPETVGRYKNENLSVFSAEQLNAVKKLGYNINS